MCDGNLPTGLHVASVDLKRIRLATPSLETRDEQMLTSRLTSEVCLASFMKLL